MKYSYIAAFLLATVVIPGWRRLLDPALVQCDSRDDPPIYEPDSATISNQIPDSHYDQSYSHPRQTPERKSYYQQSDLHYAMPQEHNQANNYQYRPQAHRQLSKEEESALSNLAMRQKDIGTEHETNEDEEKGDGNAMFHQMRQGGNNFVAPYYQRPNMMMNGGQNYRPNPQFIPPKFTMEQQIQMQMQRQQMQQRMMAAAQAQSFMNQQPQNFIQPPTQQFAQPPPQQYPQHYQQPAPVTGQAPPQVESYPGSRGAAQPVKPRYQPPPSPAPKVRYAQPATTTQSWAPQTPQQPYYDDYEPRSKE